MSQEFTVWEAKARLPELLDLAAAGIPVEITRQGAKKGRFRLVPAEGGEKRRLPGALAGKIRVPDDFDESLEV